MTLFIPRKQSMVSPTVDDRPSAVMEIFGDPIPSSQEKTDKTDKTGWSMDKEHLEKVLSQNFHAIENWANRRALSASVRGSTTETFPYNALATLSFDTKTWDYSTIASTSNQTMTIPEPGIYTVSAGVKMSHIPGAAQVQLMMNPGAYPSQSGYVAGSTSLNWTATFGGNLQKFKGGEVLSVATFGIFGTTDAAQMILSEFTITKLFDVPSKAQ